jgi:cell division protease FtsH
MKKTKNYFDWATGPKNIFLILIIGLGFIFLLEYLTEASRKIEVLSYATFLSKIEEKAINKIYIEGQLVRGLFKDGTVFEVTKPEGNLDWQMLRSHNVDFSIANEGQSSQYWYFILLLLLICVPVAAWYFIRYRGRSEGTVGGGNIFSMSKSKVRMFLPGTIKETFESVAGAAEAKEELADVVDFLHNPAKYQRLGAKITKGVLLVGAPGNGKTLLARAVAGEVKCAFLSTSGSDFIELFSGVGAARVRDLFAQARKHAPAIIFIDEIDAVGRHRSTGASGAHDEREQTLNQLLTEMDGFVVNEAPVIVIGATNRVDVLDNALLRAGRFDRHVEVPYPDLKSRLEILKVHAKNVKIDSAVDLHKIARGTPGFSGADLANLINEATILASRQEKEIVSLPHFEEARDKILLGKEIKSIALTESDKEVIAYHEGGHALARLLLPDCTDPLYKVTIIPRTNALGVTHSMPEREKYITSKEELEASMIAALGGRVAEEIVFNRLTTGAADDFRAASSIARKMVCHYGMMPEHVGTILYTQNQYNNFEYSEKTAELIDQAVKALMDSCYKKTYQLLKDNRDKLDKLAKALLEKETMYASEIYELLGIEPRVEHRFN